MIKSFTLYNEIFRLIDTINSIEKRDEFLGKLMDFYFKEKKPKFEPNSYEETIWLNISKPIIAYKSKAVNGSKGGRPKKTEIKTEIKTENKSKTQSKNESKTQSETKTTSDVDVFVNYNNNTYALEKIGCGEEKPLNIYEFIEKNFGRLLCPIEYETINQWKSKYEEEIIKYAVRIAVLGNVKTFAYTDGILKNWESCGYKTIQEIMDSNKKPNNYECFLSPDIKKPTKEEQEQLKEMLVGGSNEQYPKR